MSLATDLLQRLNQGAFLSAPGTKARYNTNYLVLTERRRAERKPKTPRKPKQKTQTVVKAPKPKLPNGVYANYVRISGEYTYRSVVPDQDGKSRSLGYFNTAERAAIAYRLYRLWARRGMENIPVKPEKRVWTRY